MTEQEILDLPGRNNPVSLLDGCFGTLIRYGDPCGIQVFGEEQIRWVDADCLECDGESLTQKEKPEIAHDH